MQRSKKIARRKHRKFVREQKQLLRRRSKPHRKRKWYWVGLTIEDMKIPSFLRNYAKEHKIGVNTACRRIIEHWMKKEQINGVQEELSKSLDKSRTE